jgi:hypothetical protein
MFVHVVAVLLAFMIDLQVLPHAFLDDPGHARPPHLQCAIARVAPSETDENWLALVSEFDSSLVVLCLCAANVVGRVWLARR